MDGGAGCMVPFTQPVLSEANMGNKRYVKGLYVDCGRDGGCAGSSYAVRVDVI